MPAARVGDLDLGQVTTGATLRYQAWYRNSAAFCSASTFNLTNGLAIVW